VSFDPELKLLEARALLNVLEVGSVRSPTYAQTSCCRARGRALRSVGRAARANKTSQDFVVSAANAIRASDDANCRCRAGVTLRASWSGGAGWARGALRPWWPALAGGANWALPTRFSLGPLRPDWSWRSRWASRPLLSD
jgi:hypothetical protein